MGLHADVVLALPFGAALPHRSFSANYEYQVLEE
jgi:hypothetical protein